MSRLKPIALSIVCAFSIAGCSGLTRNQADPPPPAQPLRAASHAPVTGQAMYRLGRHREGQGRLAQAIVAYSEALKRDPLLVDAYTRLGMALASQGRHEEAVRQFQAAAVLEPRAASAHNNLGYAYLLSGATEQAVRAFEEARRLDPGHAKAGENLRAARAKLHGNAEPIDDMRLVEVMPHVFELKASARSPAIESRPLAPAPHRESGAAPARAFRLEVSNGNGVLGLARRVAGRLAQAGVPASRLTNQRPFAQARTQIQYRDGYADEAARLAGKLQRPVSIVPGTQLARHVDVRLVLGRDAPSDSALLAPPPPRTMTAGMAGVAR